MILKYEKKSYIPKAIFFFQMQMHSGEFFGATFFYEILQG